VRSNCHAKSGATYYSVTHLFSGTKAVVLKRNFELNPELVATLGQLGGFQPVGQQVGQG
jgi:hypothetical protein